MAKKLVFTTNDPGASTDYAAADGTWKTMSGGGGGVPYTGATGDVDLGVHSLISKGTSYTPTTPPTYAEGKVWYDSAQKSLSFYNDSSLSPVFIGENIVLKVYNNTGSTISKGAPVYIQSGGSFTYPNVALAKADSPSTAAVIGLMNADTPTGNFGYVTAAGVITGVNTGGMAEGTILYLSPYSAGQLMNTIPPTGYVVQVGVVAHQNTPNGIIYTKQTTPLSISAATIVGGLTVAQGGTGVTSITASRALVSDATSKVVASATTSTELGYVSGVTSAIQTQIDSKQATITGGATTITSSNLTASRALESDSSGKVGVSTVTRVELGYLSGVTSAIQTQLNAKQGTLSVTTTGTSGAATLVGSTLNIPQYAGAGSGASMQLIAGSTTALAAGTTRYGNVAGSTSEAQQRTPVADACTMNNLFIRTTATMPANSSLAVTIFKNGVATAVTRTIAAGSAAGTYSDTSNSTTFAAGDGWNIEYKNVGTAAAAPSSGTGFKITI